MTPMTTQVTFRQTGEDQGLSSYQRGRDVRKQHVAEVVTIEGTEQDDGNPHLSILGQGLSTEIDAAVSLSSSHHISHG
jgi:hypothetical protein